MRRPERGGPQVLVPLLILALAVAAFPISSPVTHTAVDDEWAARFATTAQELVKTPSSCVPGSTVILTMSNGYHW